MPPSSDGYHGQVFHKGKLGKLSSSSKFPLSLAFHHLKKGLAYTNYFDDMYLGGRLKILTLIPFLASSPMVWIITCILSRGNLQFTNRFLTVICTHWLPPFNFCGFLSIALVLLVLCFSCILYCHLFFCLSPLPSPDQVSFWAF